MIELTIDGRTVHTRPGEKILWAALDSGIYIPHLCALKDIVPFAGCRLCLVEVEGEDEPVAACAREVAPGMKVRTRTPRLERLRRLALELILASHRADCTSCRLHRNCRLQDLAAEFRLSLRPRRLPPLHPQADEFEHPYIEYLPEKCIVCSRCLRVCSAVGKGFLDLRHRGLDTVVGCLAEPEEYQFCLGCRRCVEVCPAAALQFRE